MEQRIELEGYVGNAIRSLYQMILLVDDKTMDCQVVDFNPELRNITEEVGKFDEFCQNLFDNVHPEDREEFKKFVDADYFPDELANKVHVSLDCRIRHVSRRYRWSKITFCHASKEDKTSGHHYLFTIQDVHSEKTKELKADFEQRSILIGVQEKYSALFEENMTDAQTGCYNRKGMKYYMDLILEEARKSGKYLFVCVADLNGLKYLNDTYGHAAGDEAIAAVSAELLKAAPIGSKIVRTGGDEFLLMAALESTSSAPIEMVEKIESGLLSYNNSHPNPYKVGACYGWVLCPMKEGMIDLDEYVEIADAKMYDMKVKRDEHRRD